MHRIATLIICDAYQQRGCKRLPVKQAEMVGIFSGSQRKPEN